MKMVSTDIKHFLRLVLHNIIQSVKPKKLIKSELNVCNNTLIIQDNKFRLNRNCYVAGFGKAVYEMGCAVDDILKDHIRKGVFIVPHGSLNAENCSLGNKLTYRVFEGAENNIPDVNSYKATEELVNLVKPLKTDDLLLVLISGGGSALLTCPISPLTLEEKINVIKLLSYSGADIKELNTVRKQLSAVKGGKLAEMAYPCPVISLILSDVINDPVDMIASGPTVRNEDPPGSGLNILKKYALDGKVSDTVIKLLEGYENNVKSNVFEQTQSFIIGNNSKALASGKMFIEEYNKKCVILTTCVEGLVENISEALAQLAKYIAEFPHDKITLREHKKSAGNITKTLCIPEQNFENLNNMLLAGTEEIFLLLGGETTVNVKGKGKGGRNTELALRFSESINNLFKSSNLSDKFNVCLLSAGTDGIDGPTDSAGAVAYLGQAALAKDQDLDTESFISDNNSYNFFKKLSNGEDLIITGHTGTNVMDVIILHLSKNK